MRGMMRGERSSARPGTPNTAMAEAQKKPRGQVAARKMVTATLFAGTGAFVSFRPLFLSTIITPAQVGQILLLGSFVTTFTNTAIAALADSMQAQKALMLLSTGGQAITPLVMLLPGLGFKSMAVLCTLHSVVGAHNYPTLDASTMMVCPERYGEIRLFGSAAFGLAAFGGGGLLSLAGTKGGGVSRRAFAAAFGMASIMNLVSLPQILRLDFSALHVKQKGAAPSNKKPVASPKGAPAGFGAVVKLVSSAKMLFFMVLIFLSGCQMSIIDTFLNVHLANMGAPGLLMGATRLLQCASELPAFRMSGRILKLLGVSGRRAHARGARTTKLLLVWKLAVSAKICIEAE